MTRARIAWSMFLACCPILPTFLAVPLPTSAEESGLRIETEPHVRDKGFGDFTTGRDWRLRL